jgi:hypothetical protein
MQVVEVHGRGAQATYSLKPKHWALALEHLTFQQTVPVVPLAAFLFRDYGIHYNSSPRVADLVGAFRQEFGYNTPRAIRDEEFNLLYNDDSEDWSPEDLFEATS